VKDASLNPFQAALAVAKKQQVVSDDAGPLTQLHLILVGRVCKFQAHKEILSMFKVDLQNSQNFSVTHLLL
jgi:hypothetical protein